MNNKNTDVTSSTYKQAVHYFNEKKFRESLNACRKVMRLFPDSSNTLNLLALNAHHLKKFKTAAKLYQIANKRFPGNVVLLNNQGAILKLQGDISGAIAAYKQAIAASTQNTEALFNLAALYQETAQPLNAIECYQKVLLQDLNNIPALLRSGSVLQKMGQERIAIKAYKKVLSLEPNNFNALIAVAICLQSMDLHQDAVGYYLHALELQPKNAQAYVNLGVAYKRIENYDKAISCYEAALTIAPNIDYIYTNLANAQGSAYHYDDAILNYKKALQLNANSAEAYNGLGFTQHCVADFESAQESLDKAIALNPQHIDAHFNQGLNYLVRADFARGWPEYEWRLKKPEMISLIHQIPYPLWDGSSLDGRALMIFAEQGFGDNIQFVRYIPLIEKHGGKIYFATRPELYRLFEQVPNIDHLSNRGELLSNIDCYIPLLSLPYLFKTTPETIPADIPYLHPYDADVKRISDRFKVSKKQLKIGICWTGSPTHKNALHRSCRLDDFAPLFNASDRVFYSLQKPIATDVLAAYPAVNDLSDLLVDFAATAAVIAHLDLVITVDTAIAHLAGAMGKPVWNLLPFYNDWRWMRDRSDTAWYPTMHLFRQTQLGDWDGVFEEVKKQLKHFKKPKK